MFKDIISKLDSKRHETPKKVVYKSKPKKQKKGVRNWSISFGNLSIKDQAFFATRLSFLVRAGVPLLESIIMIREQTVTRRYSRILDVVVDDISNGQTLSSSLGKFRNTFGDFAINIIDVGESTGILSENLGYLSDELKKKQLLRRKVIGALVYPVFITIATLGITGLLTAYIFPKIMPIFTSLNVTLPITTRIVIFISDYLRNYGLLTIVGLILLAIICMIILKVSERIHYFYDSFMFKIPLVGSMVQSYNLANISRTLSLLLKGGMTLSDAIPITARTTVNRVYKSELEKLSVVINRGEKISLTLQKKPKIFPAILTQIISVGERSGNLPETLVYLSEMYEHEVDDATKNLSSLIEPVLMIVMGIIVGFVAISVITPIYGITQHLNPR